MPPTYHRYDDVLIAPPDITTLMDVLVSIGLAVAQPPKEVYDLVHMVQCHRLLTPELAHATILVCLNGFCAIYPPTDKSLPGVEVGYIHRSRQKQAPPFVGLSPLHQRG